MVAIERELQDRGVDLTGTLTCGASCNPSVRFQEINSNFFGLEGKTSKKREGNGRPEMIQAEIIVMPPQQS
jgi:hypothetical protein